MFFVYSPIVVLELGYSAKLAGMMGSIALSMTILIPLWTRLAKAIGVRRMLMFGYTISGLSMISIAVFHNSPTAVFALLILAAFCTTSIDGVGNIFFLRAVHPYERVEMSAVFATYRDISQSAPPLIVAPLLKILELPIILGALGGVMLGLAHLSRHLPRRL
jgi:MFS family permease